METRVEEIISIYMDALAANNAEPVDLFLARFPDLPPRVVLGLQKTLKTMVLLRCQPIEAEEIEQEENLASWQKLQQRINEANGKGRSAKEGPVETPASVAAFASPTVGAYLSKTLTEDPTALSNFNIPEDVLLHIAQDDNPLEKVQTTEERIRVAQRYAQQDQSLFRQIVAMLNRLSRLWLSASARPSNSLSYTRPAPPERSNN
jgi:hypothetical protein